MLKYFVKSHFIVAFLYFFNLAFAQSNLLIKVVDSDNHKNIPNANITIKYKDYHFQKLSNDSGYVSFKIPKIDSNCVCSVNISIIGYQKKTLEFKFPELKSDKILVHLNPISYAMKSVTVTCNADKNKFDELYSSINKVNGKDLQKDLSNSLALSLKNQVGVAVRSMGPAPARPVIRGLNGNRVEMAEDGVVVNDLSATSPDHASTIEPYSIESIEVVRGPKLLLFTPIAIGGFINVVRNDIIEKKLHNINSDIGLVYESANNTNSQFANIRFPIDNFNIKIEALRKISDNLKVHNQTIHNTEINNKSYTLGTSYVFENGSIGIATQNFKSVYGVPGGVVGAHPNGVDIDMLKNTYIMKLKYQFNNSYIKEIESDLSRTYYHHKEYEAPNTIGAEFLSVKFDNKINFNYENLFSSDNGTMGISYSYRDFKVGGYVFTPFVKSTSVSVYNFMNYDLSGYNIQFSQRINYDLFKAHKNSVLNVNLLKNREFFTYSLSFSLISKLTPNFNVGTMVAKTSRVPSIEELYSQGPHLAAYSYEVGNPDLKSENGVGGEIFLSYNNNGTEIFLNTFNYYLKNFIINRNTGKINYQTLLPIYQAMGANVNLSGIEGMIKYKIFSNITIKSNFSYTYAQNLTDRRPLPAIPPLKNVNEFLFNYSNFLIILTNENVLKQYRVDEFETPTNGYNLWNLSFNTSFLFGKLYNDIYFGLDNIFNVKYYNHLSRLKSILPEPGRNIRINLKIYI